MSLLKTQQKRHLHFYLLGLLPIILFLIILKPCTNLFEWNIQSGQYNISEKADQAEQLYDTNHIPAGSFFMGKDNENPDEAPRHKVTFTTGFHIMKKEVTRELYSLVMNKPLSMADGCLAHLPPIPVPDRCPRGVLV